MTEDQAKTKWCPAYRVATSGGDVSSTFETDNRPQQYERPGEDEPRGTPYKVVGLHEMGCCIGSQCMAWRWQSATDGYCGLAR